MVPSVGKELTPPGVQPRHFYPTSLYHGSNQSRWKERPHLHHSSLSPSKHRSHFLTSFLISCYFIQPDSFKIGGHKQQQTHTYKIQTSSPSSSAKALQACSKDMVGSVSGTVTSLQLSPTSHRYSVSGSGSVPFLHAALISASR